MQQLAELRGRPGPLLEELTAICQQRVEVHPTETAPEGTAGHEAPLEDWLHHRPEGQEVVRGRQVKRRPHERTPNGRALPDEVLELGGPEVLQARPQRDVGVGRHLRLHPDEVLDGPGGRSGDPVQEQLARQQGAVEGAGGEDRSRRHGSFSDGGRAPENHPPFRCNWWHKGVARGPAELLPDVAFMPPFAWESGCCSRQADGIGLPRKKPERLPERSRSVAVPVKVSAETDASATRQGHLSRRLYRLP